MKLIFSSIVVLVTMMLPTFAVSANEPEVMAVDAVVAVATVVSVDEKNRDITLVGPESDEWTFTAGPDGAFYNKTFKRSNKASMK